jgi:dihydroorotase-like cyclic amidohydrolase
MACNPASHTTATDHCTFCANQKAAGRDFHEDPNGCGGEETNGDHAAVISGV